MEIQESFEIAESFRGIVRGQEIPALVGWVLATGTQMTIWDDCIWKDRLEDDRAKKAVVQIK